MVERYDWDDWGVATATWPGAYHPFGFAGGIWDGSMGTYRFGAREYHPWEGRWWSKDASRFGGGLNFYVYANDDPVNYIDPTGHMPMDGSGAQERWSAYAASNPDEAAPMGIVMFLCALPVIGEVFEAFLLEASVSAPVVAIAAAATPAVCKNAEDEEASIEIWGGSTAGAAQIRTLQTGGNTIANATAKALNSANGMDLTSRDWGRALEALKKSEHLANDFHGVIDSVGNYRDPNTSEIIGNLLDYL